jgi:cysteinyl-tRNA synthetase
MTAEDTTAAETSRSLMEVDSWAYQLQDIDISQIVNNSTFELIVMDYSADGSDENKFTPAQISQIKNSGKIAISYISIGEAENYRYYWNESWDADSDGTPDAGAPSWLGIENPDWEGNYKVRFWNTEWQDIIFEYIDTLYAQGFDGIYCDIIDAYYYWSEENPEESLADSLMIQFILNIRDHISTLTSGDFYILPQNGEIIIEETNVSESLKSSFFTAIDGIGVEDVFHPGDLENDNPFAPDSERVEVLKEFLSNGKKVFSVEYLDNTNLAILSIYVHEAFINGFVPYVTTRSLSTLNMGYTLFINNDYKSYVQDYKLFQNYPNPFNPETTIKYELPKISDVSLKIYSILGQEVKTLINQRKPAGYHKITWDGKNKNGIKVSSGIYIYRISTGDFVSVKKMVLMK